MKNLLIFAAGVAIGAVGTLIWLRKDIKKTIEEQNNAKSAAENEKNGDSEDDLPFTMGENGGDAAKNGDKIDENADKIAINVPVSPREQQRIDYNKVIEEVKNGNGETLKVPLSGTSGGENGGYKPQIAPVPVLPRDENVSSDSVYDAPYADEEDYEDEESVVPRGEVFFEIDRDDYDNNPDYEKKVFIYYLGDHVMATESGTKISNPAMFVGVQWDDYIGHYEENASFVRNTRLHEDYMVQVEYGTYADEYGLEDA